MPNHSSSPNTQLSNIPTNVRHFQWNDDYIELLAHKLDLQKVRTMVDIGSGLGTLAGTFALYMRAGAKVYGFDTNDEAIRQAQAFAEANPYSVNLDFQVCDAHDLPLEDGQADLVVSQRVLGAVADPERVLAEMMRVVRPGGKVVVFEPNSIVQALTLDTVSKDYDLEQRLKLVRYQAYYERGKRHYGEGDDSIGDRVPTLFWEAGLEHIEVRMLDKAAALVPPYDSEEKRARAHELMTWLESFEANRETIRKYFLKGGGTEEEFDAFSAWEMKENERIRELIRREAFVHPGGMMTYLVIGQKPAV